ncbi:helix-turn-helix domain-containing protein [Amycolatopsis sp. VS8301801F10]|uniref:AlbA family DNA-binding domain-containing protein n=1 Tax=Amycolatopsis sp. VS8301801F10 TaxID=2652442 RepID=UPI0038FC29A2
MPDFAWRGENKDELIVDGIGYQAGGSCQNFELDIPLSKVGSMTLESLYNLLILHAPYRDGSLHTMDMERFCIVDFHEDGRVGAEISVNNPVYFKQNAVESLAGFILVKIGAVVDSTTLVLEYDHPPSWSFNLSLNDHSVTLFELHACIDTLHAELTPLDSNPGELKARSRGSKSFVWTALIQGEEGSIIGQTEKSWLEFKSRLSLENEADKVEFAQDIARFANSETGGILAFGYRTKRLDGIDRVVKQSPFIAADGIESRLRSIIDQRVYPPVRGLEIVRTSMDDEKICLTILVPSQVESDKPFLVHGAVIAGRSEGVFFSIIRRRGEGSIPITAREVHALLAAGYAIAREGRRVAEFEL